MDNIIEFPGDTKGPVPVYMICDEAKTADLVVILAIRNGELRISSSDGSPADAIAMMEEAKIALLQVIQDERVIK